MNSPIVKIEGLSKTYDGGLTALDDVSLEIERGEILALLGPNGAGKTTLIGSICGLTQPTAGRVSVDGFDTRDDYRAARRLIGLVPQEISLEPFEKVMTTVRFSRGLFGKPRDDAKIESILRQLSLWDKKDSPIRALSGGMKRRVLIAKALAHEPRVLFLDEPSAGVDVELRRDMWDVVRRLKEDGVTIILTTHYIEEAEEIADRIGIISGGKILLVEETASLVTRMGRKELTVTLGAALDTVPEALAPFDLRLSADGMALTYAYDRQAERTGITKLLQAIQDAGLHLSDVETRQSSLEEIFVDLVHGKDAQ